jgi:glycosyltransferase involved in cell wall biosynthesis
MKIAFLSQPGLSNFMLPVSAELRKRGHECLDIDVDDMKVICDAVYQSDTVWLEWANQLAVTVTTDMGLLNGKRTILRVHSYEAFGPWIEYIEWTRVSDLIFVAPHIRDIVLSRVPKIEKIVKHIHIIPNGVDLARYSLQDKGESNKIAYIGYINFKKAPELLMHAFERLLSHDPTLTLHIAGQFQEPRYELYFRQFAEHTGIYDKIFFEGWQHNMAEWLKDKKYVISTSLLESQGMGIMEAMATGCKPLIHDFVGAQEIYPKEYIWTTFDDLADLMHDAPKMIRYRKFVESNYSLSTVTDRIEAVIDRQDEPLSLSTRTTECKPGLTACLMVRDEEKNIRRCLESVKWADEIVIVDTGSVDNTVEICKEYTNKIWHSPWRDDFSFHRNETIEHASHEWLIQIDADEEFVGDGPKLKAALMGMENNVRKVFINLTDVNADRQPSVKFPPLRIFRNGYVHYQNIIHNEPKADGVGVYYTDAHLLHYGYNGDPELQKKKSDRTIGLLRKRLEQNSNDHKAHFYLFQSLCNIGNVDEGIPHGEAYIKRRLDCDDFNASIFYSLVTAYMAKGNLQRAGELIDEGFRVIPGDLDLAMALVDYGVALNRGELIIDGAMKFARSYTYLQDYPAATGLRFIYTNKPESLVYVLHHASMTYYKNGNISFQRLREALQGTDDEFQQEADREISLNLETLGITLNTEGE